MNPRNADNICHSWLDAGAPRYNCDVDAKETYSSGRALLPRKFTRPQTPGRLVEELASVGYVTPDEADLLRRLADLRNSLIHGNLLASPRSQDLAQFVAVLKSLIGRLPASQQSN